jgi:hypothetical protein
MHDKFDYDINIFLNESTSYKDRRIADNNIHSMSQHAIVNAFRDINFANQPRGKFEATPHDLMHMF